MNHRPAGPGGGESGERLPGPALPQLREPERRTRSGEPGAGNRERGTRSGEPMPAPAPTPTRGSLPAPQSRGCGRVTPALCGPRSALAPLPHGRVPSPRPPPAPSYSFALFSFKLFLKCICSVSFISFPLNLFFFAPRCLDYLRAGRRLPQTRGPPQPKGKFGGLELPNPGKIPSGTLQLRPSPPPPRAVSVSGCGSGGAPVGVGEPRCVLRQVPVAGD